ncbi:MAG: alpha/beta fold hydrolase [Minisyncoccia bacterium]|jgi:pimeloyl-ACP methyl ester carboxylesterase
MDITKTNSFELATFSRGDKDSRRLAILIPGRLDTKDYVNFTSHAGYLASRGFLAVAFDPPGTWESPGGIDLFTTTNYLKAINELIEYFGNRPTLLLGHSRGASVAILASMTNAAIMGIVPVMANFETPTAPTEDAMRKGFQISYRDMPPGASKTKEQKEFALPIAYWTDGARYDIEHALRGGTKPKLLIYGTHDEFTSVDVVKKLYEEIPEPKMIQAIDATHDYRYFPEAVEAVNLAVGKWLENNLI